MTKRKLDTAPRQNFTLRYKWGVSRARDSYGYNICSLYVNGDLVSRCNGGGYDMEGTVLGNWVAARFADLLRNKIKTKFYGLSFHDPDFDPSKAEVPGTGETVEEREQKGESIGLERYQAFHSASNPLPTKQHRVPLMDGACGKNCMIQILEAIGGKYEFVDKDVAVVKFKKEV